jgi:hypothetical protein
MSGIASLALRMAFVNLIRGATAAGQRVIDAPVDPIGLLLDPDSPTDTPLIAVFVQEASSSPKGMDFTGTERTLDVILFTYLPPTTTKVEDGYIFESRDAGGAAALDIISAQIDRALRFGSAVWRDVLHNIAYSIEKTMVRHVLVEIENGVRIPTVEHLITMKVCSEPSFGRPLTHADNGVWLSLDTAMRSSPDTLPFANLVKALIEGPTGMPDWRYIQGVLGTTYADIRGLGMAPQDATEDGEPGLLEQVTVSGFNSTDHPDIP